MGKKQPLIKLFVVLFFSTAFIFSFSHFGAQAFESVTNTDGKYSAGTTVGDLDVSGKTASEAISLLEEKQLEWVKNTKFDLHYSEKIVPLDLNQFHFDATQTVSGLIDGKQNTALITIDKWQVEEQVQILFPQVNSKDIDFDKLTANLITTASNFKNGSFSFNVNKDYLLTDAIKDAVINEVMIPLKEIPDDLQTVIEGTSEIEILEEATFSLLEFANKQKIEKSASLNIIATGIYQAILPTNFSVTERNISSVLPEYAGLGFEARVNSAKGADLVIANPNKSKYILELKLENRNLIVTLKGEKFLYDYKVSKKDEQLLKQKTIVQYSPFVLPGKTKVQAEGVDGKIVKVYRNIFQGEQLLTSELISEDYYPPIYRVEIHGLAGTQQGSSQMPEEQLPNNPTPDQIPDGIQTPPPSDLVQQDVNDDDLWGKPNEQPK